MNKKRNVWDSKGAESLLRVIDGMDKVCSCLGNEHPVRVFFSIWVIAEAIGDFEFSDEIKAKLTVELKKLTAETEDRE